MGNLDYVRLVLLPLMNQVIYQLSLFAFVRRIGMLARVARNVVLLAAVVLSVRDCLTQAASNPILPNADPFITLNPVQGKFLLLATAGRNITIWSGQTVQTAAAASKGIFTPTDGLTQIWSPTIWKIGEKWWILDVIFKRLMVRGFLLSDFEFASLVRPASARNL
jgi:hypothetical protein